MHPVLCWSSVVLSTWRAGIVTGSCSPPQIRNKNAQWCPRCWDVPFADTVFPGIVLLFIPGMCSILLVNICNEAHPVSWIMAGHHYRSYWRWIQRLHKPPTDSTICTSLNICKQRILVRKLSHSPNVPLTHVHPHIQYLLFPTNHLFK
jgi:hypothetical protein